jgi:hypothetical protein
MTTTDRRSPRFDLALPCGYRVRGHEGGFVSGSLSDVSRQGSCLHTMAAVGDVNDTIELRLVAPEQGAAEIVGEVMWKRKVADGWELGLEFREIDPAVKWGIIDAAYQAWHDRVATCESPLAGESHPRGSGGPAR